MTGTTRIPGGGGRVARLMPVITCHPTIGRGWMSNLDVKEGGFPLSAQDAVLLGPTTSTVSRPVWGVGYAGSPCGTTHGGKR